MKKLRMGIIGTGMAFERLHYPAYQKLSDKFEIRALCDIDFQKTDKWRKLLNLLPKDCYRDFHEMIRRKDLDAFDIMVPIELNYEVTEEVAQAGKPIITEKPLGATKKQALDARDLPKRFNIPIMVAENYRYNEDINIIRDLVRTQEAGRVYYFIQNRFVDFPNEMTKNKFPAREWRQHPEFPGGVFYDTGVHEIAALQHIFGAIESVHAFGVKQEEDFSPYSVIQTNLLFKSGVTGQFTFFCAGKETQRPLIGLRIFCDNGMIYLEERDCGTINVFYNDGGSKQIPYQPQMGFYHELLNFYKAASGKEPLAVTPELEYGDALAIFAILDSLENRKEVKVAARANYEPAYQ
ncbi:MAG TPA: Gfo/Idh/MocA family oxidoreductase [Firmicutes bacterium]|nr:Gfo/Idh/MocA family oxidoreductase [Bacillota bacterium]